MRGGVYLPFAISAAPALVGTESKGTGNNPSGSFLLSLNPREAHATDTRHRSAAAARSPGRGDLRTQLLCWQHPRGCKVRCEGQAQLHHIPARVSGSGITVFSHDTLLPITDSASLKKKKKRGGGSATYLSCFCLKTRTQVLTTFHSFQPSTEAIQSTNCGSTQRASILTFLTALSDALRNDGGREVGGKEPSRAGRLPLCKLGKKANWTGIQHSPYKEAELNMPCVIYG